MLSQKGSQLVLEAGLFMMLLLPPDICRDLFQVRLADREIRVARLPLKIRDTLLLNPLIRDTFQLFDPFPLGNRASESRQEMHVILYSAHHDGRTIQTF